VGNLYVAKGVAMCRSCGFASPALDMCRVTSTCVQCAREILKEKCNNCPDKDNCHVAIEGVKFLKSLESSLDIYIDFAKYLVRHLEKYDRVEIGIAFVKNLMGLIKLLQREPSAKAFPIWVVSIFHSDVVSKLSRVPYIVTLDLTRPLREFCLVYKCSGLEPVINNLLNAVVSLSLIEGIKDPRRYFRLGV
jgi:hypothetical protein